MVILLNKKILLTIIKIDRIDIMNLIQEMNLKNKTIVLRCDYNVPVLDNVITDNSKIVRSLKTINYLLNNNCKIIILSHFGRVKTEEDKKNNSLKIVAKELSNLLNKRVIFINNCYSNETKKIIAGEKRGSVILLENTRFTDIPTKMESNNDEKLSKYFASLGDIYINDAFASMHREHSSTAGIAKYLPHGIGFLVEKEIDKLDILVNNTPHPFTVFMGGAKVDDKLPIIKSLIERCDYLLLGGGIANSFLKAKGENIGDSLATNDENILNELKELMKKYNSKIILPIDFTIDNNVIYDLGINSIYLYKKYINLSEVIFVNGTCGKFEDDRFSEGTKEFLKVLKESNKKVIIGGGDTASAVNKFGYNNSFYHVSSGGGATLEYIADKSLKALDWMK